MKKVHKLILVLLVVYFAMTHITHHLEINALEKRADSLEVLLLMQGKQQEQIIANQDKFMSSEAPGPEFRPHPQYTPFPDVIPDHV